MTEPYILFIASWYPDEIDPTLGIFIRRHAEAVALYKHVKVLYLKQGNKFGIERRTDGNIEEIEVRYRNLIPRISMYSAFMRATKLLVKDHKPEVIHAHVTIPAGYLAAVLSRKLDIPFGITEHWTGYLPGVNQFKGPFLNLITRYAIRKASFISPVSQDLSNAMQQHALRGRYEVVPNVAHPVFFKEDLCPARKKFVHISSMDENQKNISGLLRAFGRLQEEDQEVELLMAGDGPDKQKAVSLAKKLELKNIEFPGNLEAAELAKHLAESKGSVLFSNFENLPCVIIESYACGAPVISTDVGGVREIVDHSKGVLIKAGDEEALLNAFRSFLDENKFNRKEIRKNAFEKFSYEAVGKAYMKLYESMHK